MIDVGVDLQGRFKTQFVALSEQLHVVLDGTTQGNASNAVNRFRLGLLTEAYECDVKTTFGQRLAFFLEDAHVVHLVFAGQMTDFDDAVGVDVGCH